MIFLVAISRKYIIIDSMKITELSPDQLILRELGRRIAHLRKQQGFTQTELSEEAGIGIATLRRIESGSGGQMETWLKILKTLGLVSNIDEAIPPIMPSPLQEAKGISGRRRPKPLLSTISWGDESP